jgi:cob(I)alamin adenosyltransferase
LKIYTKTGDKGETGLIGGTRVSKSDQRIMCYGSVDELNSNIGFAISSIAGMDGNFSDIMEVLVQIQNDLFVVGSDLADPDFTSLSSDTNAKSFPSQCNSATPRTGKDMVLKLEGIIDKYELELEPIRFFILPGGSKEAAILHICRSVARRAETLVVQLGISQEVNPEVVVYLNRLSDLLFVLARLLNKRLKIVDVRWQSN